jgi:phage host-nuclease inhibitor protein Gam
MKTVRNGGGATATRQDAELTMEKLARAQYAMDGLTAELNLGLSEVRARFELQIQAYQAEYEATEKLLKEWAKANRTAAGDSKTIEMVHGTIEFRTGMPTVKIASGQTEEAVIERLEGRPSWTPYLRTLREINKEQILADRDALSDAELAEIGLKITQIERIHVTPKAEEVTA